MTITSKGLKAKFASAMFAGLLIGGVAVASPAFAKWDSIAIDDSIGTKGGQAGYGVGTGSSRSEAEKDAMHNCKHEGNDGCKIEISYQNMCGAYASTSKYAGHGMGSTERSAKAAALETCGNDNCKIVVSDCVEE